MMACNFVELVSWSLTSLFSTNMAISETSNFVAEGTHSCVVAIHNTMIQLSQVNVECAY